MDYKVVYTNSAEHDLERLEEQTAIRVLKKVDHYSKLKNPLLKAKKMKGFDQDTYRFRVGDYRVVFRLDKKSGELIILVVLRIKHRKEIYKSL